MFKPPASYRLFSAVGPSIALQYMREVEERGYKRTKKKMQRKEIRFGKWKKKEGYGWGNVSRDRVEINESRKLELNK
jgi:hypothetical protein